MKRSELRQMIKEELLKEDVKKASGYLYAITINDKYYAPNYPAKDHLVNSDQIAYARLLQTRNGAKANINKLEKFNDYEDVEIKMVRLKITFDKFID